MKTINFYICAFAVVIATASLFSCSQTEYIIEDEAPKHSSRVSVIELLEQKPVSLHATLSNEEQVALRVQKKGTYRISEIEAVQSLERFAANDGNSTLRTKSVNLKKSSKTGKDLYYEVVFEGKKGTGFAMLSADERADNMLCYTEVGSISDTSFIKNMKFCLELIDLYVEEQTKVDLNIDVLALSANSKLAASGRSITKETNEVTLRNIPAFDPNIWTYAGSVYNSTLRERIKQVEGGWHQDEPFNNLLDNIGALTKNRRAWVGCQMIAVSLIMAYHKRPFGGYISTNDWASIINDPEHSALLQLLMRDLHNAMYTERTISYTESTNSIAQLFLNNNGYTAGPNVNYSFNTMWDALQYGPNIMRGESPNSGRHAWAVEGVRYNDVVSYDLWTYNYNGKILEYQDNYMAFTNGKQVRCDWGWKGGVKTWCSDNVFKFVDLLGVSNDFNSNLQMLSYIK